MLKPSVQPNFILQSATQDAVIQPAISISQSGIPVRDAPNAGSRPSVTPSANYSGQMNLPASEEIIDSTGAPAQSTDSKSITHPSDENLSPPLQRTQTPVWMPSQESVDDRTIPGVRITSQPMNSLATQAQALFAEQTDSQLTQGSATAIHALPKAPPAALNALPGSRSQYTIAQYTPSAQEAATGAYSVPKQPSIQQPAAQQPAAHAKPSPTRHRVFKHRKNKRKAAPTLGEQAAPTPTLDHVPAVQEYPQQVQAPAEVPAEPEPATTGAGLTDQELMQRNLPPLRGPWIRIQREAQPLGPREEVEMQLRSIESGYSGWLGAAGIVNYRFGNPGYDQLAALEAPFEASAPLGYNARVALIVKPVFLDSGQANGNCNSHRLGGHSARPSTDFDHHASPSEA